MDGDANFFRLFAQPYVSQVTVGLDMSHAVAGVARNFNGQFSVRFAWAPATVFAGLYDLVGAGRQTATLNHPAVPDGSISLRVEVLDVRPEADAQYAETDPLEGLIVDFVSHGEPS
jgi:hypothetical protein